MKSDGCSQQNEPTCPQPKQLHFLLINGINRLLMSVLGDCFYFSVINRKHINNIQSKNSVNRFGGLVPQRGGWCRGGSRYVCCGVVGILTLKTKQFQRFLVSWFQSFKISKFRRFRKSFNVFGKIWISCEHNAISCFLENIDFIFKMFKKC